MWWKGSHVYEVVQHIRCLLSGSHLVDRLFSSRWQIRMFGLLLGHVSILLVLHYKAIMTQHHAHSFHILHFNTFSYTGWDVIGFYPVYNGINQCRRDQNSLSLVPVKDPEGPLEKTLAECCRDNFPLHYEFNRCMGDSSGNLLPPCTPSPWGRLSNLWYFKSSEGKCVRECDLGEECSGQAMEGELYTTFAECCQTHLGDGPNSPCPKGCSATYWDEYFQLNASIENKGFHPNCK